MTDSYPLMAARTARFTLGIPRAFTVAPDGSKVWYLRTPDGLTRTGLLHELDVASGSEIVLADPRVLLAGDEDLPPEERARRERSRESGAGIVDYAVDDTGRWASFALSGQVWAVHLGARAATALQTPIGAVDPRVDPTGRNIAYVANRELRVIGVNGADDRPLARPESPTEAWGLAEFIAAEELGRHRGYWWAPDGRSLLAERFDEAPVDVWHVGNPAEPATPPVAQRYPAAGTANALVTLSHIQLDGTRVEVDWDHDAYEYLTSVTWTPHGPPVIQVLSRDQKRAQIRSVDVATGSTTVLRDLRDDAWIDVTSAPRFGPGGRLVSVEDLSERRAIVVDGEPVGDPAWQVRSILGTTADDVMALASTEPTEVQLVAFGFDGSTRPVTKSAAVHAAATGGPTTVLASTNLSSPTTSVTVRSASTTREIAVLAAQAPVRPSVQLLRAGPDELRTAVLFPEGHEPGSSRLPVIMNPYAGPHAQRVLASSRSFFEPQWMANQGYCVVVADGRGTPGRGPQWERAVLHDLAAPVLDDQLAALQAVADVHPDDVDPGRVGIVGWSFGGYLAALAVLRRPDVFHAAVAGAPVTDWRLYDTAYTERYLGHPATNPGAYDATSLIPLAPELKRPLLLVHGLADDNVFAAHTLQLSAALLAASRPHAVLPLSGITHMASQESVAVGIAEAQMAFFADNL
ncbi:MAG TPA: prolyl oligopeptidase family serine peptidase [Aeromicrobium sp.]|nr:prolyl oligopeptidase family serine peptidase [Aeromicrobium sp.]